MAELLLLLLQRMLQFRLQDVLQLIKGGPEVLILLDELGVLFVEVLLGGIFVLEIAGELIDGAVEQFLHGVVCFHHEGLQLAAHRVALAVRIRRKLLTRCLFAPALHSCLKVLSAGWFDLPGVDFNQSVLIKFCLAMRPHGLVYCDLCYLRLVVEVLLEFMGALGGGDAAARGLVGLSGESFEVLLKIAHLTVIIKTDKIYRK